MVESLRGREGDGVHRNRRSSPAETAAPARKFGGLGACFGLGSEGNGRGDSGVDIGTERGVFDGLEGAD